MYKLIRPLLFQFPPETAHALAVAGLKAARPFLPLFSPWLRDRRPALEREVFGLKFPNPVGLAAGMDKTGELADAWPDLGFGFVELGTFTARAQPGNPKPRVFRYPAQRAIINAMGFNNPGARAAAEILRGLKLAGRWPACPLGISLGKSKVTPLDQAVDDYLFSVQALKPYAGYFAVNVSSPNTPGLRTLQNPRQLKQLMKAVVKAASGVPILLKLAPDLSGKALKQAAETALGQGCAGLIAFNTTLSRHGLPAGEYPPGGLSGGPLFQKSTEILGELAKMTRNRVPIIGVGGIFSGEDIRIKLDAGASLVQVYTGFIYEGPCFARNLCQQAW